MYLLTTFNVKVPSHNYQYNYASVSNHIINSELLMNDKDRQDKLAILRYIANNTRDEYDFWDAICEINEIKEDYDDELHTY